MFKELHMLLLGNAYLRLKQCKDERINSLFAHQIHQSNLKILFDVLGWICFHWVVLSWKGKISLVVRWRFSNTRLYNQMYKTTCMGNRLQVFSHTHTDTPKKKTVKCLNASDCVRDICGGWFSLVSHYYQVSCVSKYIKFKQG